MKQAITKTPRPLTFNDVVNDFFNFAQAIEKTARTEVFDNHMKANISEADNAITLSIALPGVEKKAISMEANQGYLTVSVATEEGESSENKIWKEYDYTSSTRKFKLSDAVDPESIKAELKDGILVINLTKKPAFVPKTIKIK